ncbi:hypothetical protein ETD86_29950 [Nonomuraea turkmeniaca]|uniref:Uncharacterized protein n=1 Tax=Nonomuraea turkmeniaca TaxID=103838 RepID=A0A5S4FAT7_9ACTN|nr:hypothetical protein [Nonomuraea turkmeniaca]TMR13791.1 hypothetical protein ETD86_29950 [Nonomuraea turkmeniaca]
MPDDEQPLRWRTIGFFPAQPGCLLVFAADSEQGGYQTRWCPGWLLQEHVTAAPAPCTRVVAACDDGAGRLVAAATMPGFWTIAAPGSSHGQLAAMLAQRTSAEPAERAPACSWEGGT